MTARRYGTHVSRRSAASEDIRAPAPYNLTELQKDANRYHNLTAIQVQDITQGLYEKKLISYPRTASRLLTRDVYDTLPAVMEKILFPQGIPPIRQNDGLCAPPNDISAQETTDHHTIIVTGMPPGTLNKEEQLVYTLILGRTLEAFMPSCRVEYTTIDVVCAARKFSVQTYRALKRGGSASSGGNILSQGGCPVPHFRISPRESRYR